MNIVTINQYAGSPVHGMEYRPYYLGREWVREGHRVVVIAGSYSHLRLQQPQTRGGRMWEVIDGIEYMWVPVPTYPGNGVRRAVNIFSFVGKLAVWAKAVVKKCQPSVVVASSTHPLDVFVARSMASRANAKLIWELHDLWPLTPKELGRMRAWHPFIALLQAAENYACKHVDNVVSILPNTEGYLRKHGLAAGKFHHYPNGIDLSEWDSQGIPIPEEHTHVIAEIKSKGHLIVGYAGSHGLGNSLYALIHAARELQGTPITIVLNGKGSAKADLRTMVTQWGMQNVVFLPPVSKSAIPTLLGHFDMSYMGAPRKALYRYGVSPNKLFEYMAAKRPVIYAVEAANNPVEESGCGITTPAEDPPALADAIRQIARMPGTERALMGERGYQYVATRHDYRVLADRIMQEVFTGLRPAVKTKSTAE